MAFLLDHLPPQVAPGASAPGPTPPCRWPGCGRAASWSRSAPPTCASRADEAAAYLNEAMGLRPDRRRRRRAGGAHRGLDRRAPARRALARRARDDVARLHRGLRRRRPLRRRLPRRGGPRTASPTTCATSCSRPRSSTGSPARCATPSPAGDGGKAHARGARSGEPVPRPPRRPPPLVPLPPPLRRRAPRPPARRAPGAEVADAAPPRERLVRRDGDAPARVRHALAAGDPGGPPTWSSWRSRRCAGSGESR